MALPLFVVSTADSEGVLGVLTIGTYYWNEISKQLVTTRLTKYSNTAFAIKILYPHESPKLGFS
jgi:hypothetical protein